MQIKYTIYIVLKREQVSIREMHYTRTHHRCVLEEVYIDTVETSHDTFEDALIEIEKNRKALQYLEVTILPVITF